MKNQFKVGDRVMTIGRYSGLRSGPYTVVKVSPTGAKVTIYKPEFQTKKEEFNFFSSYGTAGRYANNYTGFLIAAN